MNENNLDDAEELVDVYDENGRYIRTMRKKDTLEKNEWLKCATCFVMDRRFNVLIQIRGKNKLKEPGKKDLTSGHVGHNQVYTNAMIRELEEEDGIKKEKSIEAMHQGRFIRLGNLKMEFDNWRCLTDVFVLFRKELGTQGLIFNSEVENVEMHTYESVINMIRNNDTRFKYTQEYEKIFEALKKEIQKQKERRNPKIKLGERRF